MPPRQRDESPSGGTNFAELRLLSAHLAFETLASCKLDLFFLIQYCLS
jgi:hypothetical protein